MLFRNAIAGLSALSMVSAAPASSTLYKRTSLSASSCSNPVKGLSSDACKLMAAMPFQGMGANSGSGQMAIGGSNPNKFTFTNGGSEEVTVVGWTMQPGSYVSMDMNVSPAAVTHSLKGGESVTVDIANGVSGSFSGLYSDTKMVNGQVSETWLEFTTGAYATIDVSREVNMNGKSMAATVKGSGCKSNMSQCVFKCKNGMTTCGKDNEYELDNCAAGSQTGANYGTTQQGQPSGGCTGFNNGGEVDIVLNGNGSTPPSKPSSGSGSSTSSGGNSGSGSSAPSPAPAKSSPASPPSYNPAPASSPAPAPAPASPPSYKQPPTKPAASPAAPVLAAAPAASPAAPAANNDQPMSVVSTGNGQPLQLWGKAYAKVSGHKTN